MLPLGESCPWFPTHVESNLNLTKTSKGSCDLAPPLLCNIISLLNLSGPQHHPKLFPLFYFPGYRYGPSWTLNFTKEGRTYFILHYLPGAWHGLQRCSEYLWSTLSNEFAHDASYLWTSVFLICKVGISHFAGLL